jgi:DNA repair protein RadC
VPASPCDRPRERLRREGAQALSTSELLSLALGSGSSAAPAARTATELLERFGTLERLEQAGDAEIAVVPGMGPAKIASLRAAFEIGSRLARGPLRIGERLSSPEQVYQHFGVRLRNCRQERFLALLVDTRHRLVAEIEVSRGSLNQSLVHPREVFAPAVRESAAAVLALHNHPSGDPLPSREDHEVTRRLAEAGEILGIRLLDHVVVGGDGFVSFAREGWIAPQGGWRARR